MPTETVSSEISVTLQFDDGDAVDLWIELLTVGRVSSLSVGSVSIESKRSERHALEGAREAVARRFDAFVEQHGIELAEPCDDAIDRALLAARGGVGRQGRTRQAPIRTLLHVAGAR